VRLSMKNSLVILLLLVSFPLLYGQSGQKHFLFFKNPIDIWDEALPLGNGLLGALVWGDGSPLKISLDRTDLWDLRPVREFQGPHYSYETMKQWVRQGRIEDLRRLYEDPYRNPGPTKIPAGRIEIRLEESSPFQFARLDLPDATARMAFKNGSLVTVFIHALFPVGFIRIQGSDSLDPKLVIPPFSRSVKNENPRNTREMELALLGYPPAVVSQGDSWTGYVQKGWGESRFAVVLMWRKEGKDWIGVWSIANSIQGDDPLKIAFKHCRQALKNGFYKARESHLKWWKAFWEKSSIQIPNPIIERQWYLETYKFGSAARSRTPPITLQGPWTADNGLIPPWKGDYHHDLNTQLSYWPCYSGNHLEEGLGFVNWLWQTKENARVWTFRFFKEPGLNVPMTADLKNNQIGGWHQYTHSSTTSAWLAHHFYLHWRYSKDRAFLEERAYPYLREVAVFLEAITALGPDGKRTLPLSSSPEINDNRLEAWFPSITNYDLSLIRWVFKTTSELSVELGKREEAERWSGLLKQMPELAIDATNKRLLVAKDYPLRESHRHFSHLMAIHPLGLIRWENGEEDREIIKTSLADLERLGSSFWTGYSFAWLANLAARARDGERAEQALEIFATAFCLRNSFHCNGDQSGKGYSEYTYRPFTLEGNFAAAAGIQEMLIQSYSGQIRIFPAIPKTWKDVSFKSLRAEGAFLISAVRQEGLTQRVEILAEKGGLCRLEDPFCGERFQVIGTKISALKKKGEEIALPMSPDQKVVLFREKEQDIR
jgi:alpha-L-fucosidase 2